MAAAEEGAASDGVSPSEGKVHPGPQLVGVVTGEKWAESRLTIDTLVEYGQDLVRILKILRC